MHLQIRNERVRVGELNPPRPCMEVHSPKSESRRNQRGTRYIRAGDDTVGHLLRVERLTIEDQLGGLPDSVRFSPIT